MKLTIFERLTLLNLLPPKGDLTTIRIVRETREELSFSEFEHKKLQFIQTEGSVTWNPEAAESLLKDVKLGRKAREIIVAQLDALNESDEVEERHLSLFEKFGLMESEPADE